MTDLIKREDAIKHFKAKAAHYRKRLARIEAQGDAIGYDPTEQINGFKDEIAIYEDVVKEIKGIPSAENKGEWIDMGDFEQCSVCKGTHLKEFESYYGKTTWIKTPYCPNCGARMKGADNE